MLLPGFLFELSLIVAVALALVQLFAGRLRFLSATPRSIWLSASSGASIAYVFVHILPELGEAQAVIREVVGGWLAFWRYHIYVVALLSLAIFYGLDRAAIASRRYNRKESRGDVTAASVFWLHIIVYGFYNTIIGYLLLNRDDNDAIGMLQFALAMALHFAVNDYGLREHHKFIYNGIGRWVLATAVIVGWTLGSGGMGVDRTAIALMFAFLAGGIILNVLKEELPAERESRFWAFALGAGAYTLLLALSPSSS
ncbi:hypothetical protein C7B80_02630 [Cyanosarcina cf. burmensis CCALA 770]|jgi:hypothetical protein|nr:hypothetical protein C7B80_02630 [Cyanosarcina cf. burmensis CCALA 770]